MSNEESKPPSQNVCKRCLVSVPVLVVFGFTAIVLIGFLSMLGIITIVIPDLTFLLKPFYITMYFGFMVILGLIGRHAIKELIKYCTPALASEKDIINFGLPCIILAMLTSVYIALSIYFWPWVLSS